MKTITLLILGWIPAVLSAQSAYTLPVPAYRDGEKITYEISYGPITGGQVTGTVQRYIADGKDMVHSVITAKTTGLADIIYKILDIYESDFDYGTGLPVRSIRNVQEGSYRQFIEAKFDRKKNLYRSSLDGIHKGPRYLHDITSSFYYFRSLDYTRLKEGDIIVMQTYFGDELFAFKIRYRGKEVIKTSLGKFSCYKFAPVTEVGRAFASEDDMDIWMSDDVNHVPIRAKLNLRVGSIKCDLISYSSLKGTLKTLP